MFFHIEFMGLPGSGKSTLTKIFCEILAKNNICGMRLNDAIIASYKRSINNRWLKFIYGYFPPNLKKGVYTLNSISQTNLFLKFITVNPGIIAFLFNSYCERKFLEKEIDKDLQFIYKLFSKYQICKDYLNDSEGIIIDEGFLYHPIRILSSSKEVYDFRYIEKYLELIAMPQIVFRLSTDYELCFKRIHERPSGPPSKLGKREKEDAIRFLELCDSYINVIASQLPKHGVQLVNLSTNQEISDNHQVFETMNDITIQLKENGKSKHS